MSITKQEIETKLKAIICKEVSVKETELLGNTAFRTLMDSLSAVQVLMAVEKEFGLELPDNAVFRFRSLNTATAYLAKELGVEV